MEYSAEERFVHSFIKKNKRERLLYELTTPQKKRKAAGVSRFCHQAEEFIDASGIIMKGSDLERQPEFVRFVRQHDETCRILSDDFWLAGWLPFEEAVEQAILSAGAVLILGSTFAVVFTGFEKGGRDKYLLCE